jgi:hypothetical protein
MKARDAQKRISGGCVPSRDARQARTALFPAGHPAQGDPRSLATGTAIGSPDQRGRSRMRGGSS